LLLLTVTNKTIISDKLKNYLKPYPTVFLERVSRESLPKPTPFTYPFSTIVRTCFKAEI